MKALIVDDSKATRLILKKILTEAGFKEFVEAAHGREALDRLAAGAPDLALVDWNMPEMDGYELLCAIRARRELDQMPIMMVTTETEVEQVTRALSAGANEYVMKPFSSDIIRDKLALLGIGG
ncbi:MAG: response regulator [Polyangiaceae bacterium]